MQIVRGLENLPGPDAHSVVTDGAFDGVHLGHQALLQRAAEVAQRLGGPSCVVTYEPLPSEFFGGDTAGSRLTLLEEKLECFRSEGLDLCAVLRFDKRLSEWDCQQFVRRVLREGLGAAAVVVGAGHTLGAGGRGNVETLRRLGTGMGFAVELVPDAMCNGERVSSSGIRRALRGGDVAKAAEMLGRPYCVRGTVSPGKGVGETLGYPTANLPVDERKLLPADGVYAGYARDGVQEHDAVAHVGGSPTFGEAERLVEVHVLDRHLDLDGQEMCFEMVERIREPIRFPSREQLKAQIQADVERAREVLLESRDRCAAQ